MKLMEEVRLVSRSQQNASDQKPAHHEKEDDARPAPEAGVIEPRALESRVAVIDDYGQDREAAQPVEFRQVSGKPSWALHGQGRLPESHRLSAVSSRCQLPRTFS